MLQLKLHLSLESSSGLSLVIARVKKPRHKKLNRMRTYPLLIFLLNLDLEGSDLKERNQSDIGLVMQIRKVLLPNLLLVMKGRKVVQIKWLSNWL